MKNKTHWMVAYTSCINGRTITGSCHIEVDNEWLPIKFTMKFISTEWCQGNPVAITNFIKLTDEQAQEWLEVEE